ncbi:MAG TPA: arylesterase, partial [Gemmatimonadetes bacterium]|nr:arylesterase [Gemmatimonadota bacterium]
MIVRSLFILLLLPITAAGCGPTDDARKATGASTEKAPAATSEPPPYPGHDQSAPREAGPRVVFMGTSLTAGLGLRSTDEAFTARLQAIADSAAVPARIVNVGVSGETSAGGLRRIAWVVADTIDVLVLELGANDGMRGQDTEALAHNPEAIIDSTRAHWPAAEIVLAGMQAPPNLGARYTSAFRAVFPTVARKRRTVLVPFLLEGVAGVRTLNQEDGIHPTSEGHERIARTMWL